MKIKGKCEKFMDTLRFKLPDGKIIDEKIEEGPATFETAITATGIGKFNVILLSVIAIPAAWAAMMSSTTTAYILPMAQCDLNLSLKDKGLLNAVVYVGMITTGFFWGFISDTSGRKKLLVVGFLLNAFFVIIAASSQSFRVILFAKFMDGAIINGPFAAFTSVLSEFHGARYRAKIILFMGVLYSTANIILPLMGWLILPLDIEYKLFGGYLVLHSWNIFLFASALPSLVSGILNMLVPESPKFLMTAGKNEEALEVFKKIYHWNTGNDPNTFPVKVLINEVEPENILERKQKSISVLQTFKNGWKQITAAFFPPHGLKLLLVCSIQFGVMMGSNTIRLWLPQIFTAINDYEMENGGDTNLCDMLITSPHPNSTSVNCSVNTANDPVYINSIIGALAAMLAYFVAGGLINILGKKLILFVFGTTGGILTISLYFASTAVSAVTIAVTLTACIAVCSNVMMSVVVDLFPTSLRTSTISFTMMTGRFGAMIGNVIFPIFLEIGCLPPFAALGGIVLTSVTVSTLLPRTDLKALQ